MTSDEPIFDAERALHDIRTHVRVIQDELTTSSTRATHGEWLAERVEELDTWLSQRVHDVALPRDWDRTVRRDVRGVDRVRANDATHPREVPEPDPGPRLVDALDPDAVAALREPEPGDCGCGHGDPLPFRDDEHAPVARLESAITAGEAVRRKLAGDL